MRDFQWGYLLGLATAVPATLAAVAAVFHLNRWGEYGVDEQGQGWVQLAAFLSFGVLSVLVFLRRQA